ncbi:MAG: cyclopropane-fatty-acyl-phospholipid synthase family protein [Gammaproteobacteria bacterium]
MALKLQTKALRMTDDEQQQRRSNILGIAHKPGRRASRVTALDHWLVKKMLSAVGRPAISVVLWDGTEITTPEAPVSVLTIHDRQALFFLLLDPEYYFGDLYSSGRVEVLGDFIGFLETVYLAIHQCASKSPWHKLMAWRHHPRANTLYGSRGNITHHYDLSNDFYKLWLDREAMQYTCAYFPQEDLSLEEAQVAKLHHICRKLQLKPGETVVEAGCGWGGLARFMAKHYGVKVRAFNISHEQIVFARSKALEQGLADRVEYVEDDYRNIQGQYDVFVSVGMLEHVGAQHFHNLGNVIARVLKPSGRGLIHSIGRNSPGLMNAWIEKRIFPGAYPPSLREMMDIFEPHELSVLDVENLRLHYAKTLEHWLERFDASSDQVRNQFDEAFVRAWRLYLAGSMAAFTTGELQLFQVVFNQASSNDVPWSRAHLYQ